MKPMKPITGVGTAPEDKVRKSLHELQPSAIDKETLVGADRMIKSNQQVKETKSKKNVLTKKKETSKKQIILTTNDKATQTVRKEKKQIDAEDLTCTAGPSENYWQVLAERRHIAIKDVLKGNKELSKRIEKIEEETRIYKEMLDDTKALAEELQDIMEDNRNGINNSLEDSVL